ncbi:FAD/NAD(P)-binding domain-containing protein [Rhizopus microsporus var. microsporus]|uniref:FAD/NAD(P)-binding domain-containing protein n=1 Tax=Rhizopus microsporus var. microsporus TaxID=86635 RepID=A0A1X0R5R4_RHIZD|nr:FAD/NAD(P)-binding domain-containing protein [Rhizopus microsporus var. microsporus]
MYSNNQATPFKVIIIGGGISGLTLANALKNKKIAFEVFERDSDSNCRGQGWSITLHTGLDSLHQCIPAHRFENFGHENCVNHEANESGLKVRFIDGRSGKDGMLFYLKEAYRVKRVRFRKWLLKDVEEHVHWSKKMVRYEEHDDGVKVFFEDGTCAEGDLLIAADGSMSPIAHQLLKSKFDELTNLLPLNCYGACRWITEEEWNRIFISPKQHATINGTIPDQTVDGVVNMVYTLNKIDRSQPATPYEIAWFISRWDRNGLFEFPDGTNNAKIMSMVKSWAATCFPGSPVHQQFVLDTPDDTPITGVKIRERKPDYDLLVNASHRVVLVGDAAHPMSMFRGEGANHAIIDVAQLAEQIGAVVAGTKSLDKAVEDYYKEMVPRGQKAVSESHVAAEMVHTQPEGLADLYKSMMARFSKK